MNVEDPTPEGVPGPGPGERDGPARRAALLLDGLATRAASKGGLERVDLEGGAVVLRLGRVDVLRLVPQQGTVAADLDPRAGAGNPVLLRRLGSPHPDAALSARGWRQSVVRTRADAARIVSALRRPRSAEESASRGFVRETVPGTVLVGAVRVRRLLDPPSEADGTRVLVDAAWPHDAPRDRAAIGVWMKEAAPSPRVREAFGPAPARLAVFRRAYLSELRGSSKAEAVSRLRHLAREGTLTLVTAVRDVKHSAAFVLARAVAANRTPTV